MPAAQRVARMNCDSCSHPIQLELGSGKSEHAERAVGDLSVLRSRMTYHVGADDRGTLYAHENRVDCISAPRILCRRRPRMGQGRKPGLTAAGNSWADARSVSWLRAGPHGVAE